MKETSLDTPIYIVVNGNEKDYENERNRKEEEVEVSDKEFFGEDSEDKSPEDVDDTNKVENLDKDSVFDAVGKHWQHAVAILDKR